MEKYRDIMHKIINEDYTLLTKLFLLYELEGALGVLLDDRKIDELYCEYMDNNNVNNVSEFIQIVINRGSEEQQ